MNEYVKDLLRDNLEQILFEKKHLVQLKERIDQLATGTITPKELRQEIIDFRMEVMERLLKFFPFLLKSATTQKQLQHLTEPSNKCSEELEEKNKLLEEIGNRVNQIYENLHEQ